MNRISVYMGGKEISFGSSTPIRIVYENVTSLPVLGQMLGCAVIAHPPAFISAAGRGCSCPAKISSPDIFCANRAIAPIILFENSLPRSNGSPTGVVPAMSEMPCVSSVVASSRYGCPASKSEYSAPLKNITFVFDVFLTCISPKFWPSRRCVRNVPRKTVRPTDRSTVRSAVSTNLDLNHAFPPSRTSDAINPSASYGWSTASNAFGPFRYSVPCNPAGIVPSTSTISYPSTSSSTLTNVLSQASRNLL
mmetsp:Transcript_4349/g.12337  ORF Transcript_4349/g.12337 Transcript_4349/m.12337 type:complete len:250 (-) Transcript_4349:215-964(-)